jgi:hypothetical protein
VETLGTHVSAMNEPRTILSRMGGILTGHIARDKGSRRATLTRAQFLAV